jgi:hypothetical protein
MYDRRLICRHVNDSAIMAPNPGGHHSIATFKLRNVGPTAEVGLVLQVPPLYFVWDVTPDHKLMDDTNDPELVSIRAVKARTNSVPVQALPDVSQ